MSNETEAAVGVAYMDGQFMPLAEATVPVLDRGFRFSDITYDALHVWQGRFFRLPEHVARFRESIAGLRMSLPHTDAELTDVLMECVRRLGARDAFVMVMCSRGVQPPGTRDPRLCRNRLYAWAQPFLWQASEAQRRDGWRMVVSRTQRIPSAALDQRIKNFHWLDLTMSLFEAYDQGADVTVLPLADGTVTEGPGFNVFVVKDGALVSPATGMFEGITRRTVAELAAGLQMRCEFRAVTEAEVRGADEIFTATTAGGITPVTWIDGRALGDGTPGPVTRRLRDLYWALHDDPAYGTAVEYRD